MCVRQCDRVRVNASHLFVSLKRERKRKWGCEHACTLSVRKRGCPCVCVCMCSIACVCASERASVCVCVCAHGPPPLSPCSVGSAGNVTPVPGIAASLDPGNSDDRNRRLLPLRRTHCLATGSPHTRPKPFLKASSSFAAVPLLLFLLCFSPPHVLFVLLATLTSSLRPLLLLFLCWFINA